MEISKIAYDKIKRPFVRFCQKAHITANGITYFNHFITLTLGCYAFSRGEYVWWLVGLGVMFLNGFLDYLDGDVARATGGNSKLGAWLDSGFDVVIQNAVMGAIAIGCFKMGLPLIWIVLFFVSNAGNNLVSFQYNQTFGFNSASGNALFREYMDRKPTHFNFFLENIIDPTTSFFGLYMFTLRYWIVLGCVLDWMPFYFIIMTIISNFKWFVLFVLYALHQANSKKLYVLQALAILDEERNEFYRIRYGQKV